MAPKNSPRFSKQARQRIQRAYSLLHPEKMSEKVSVAQMKKELGKMCEENETQEESS